MKAVILAGGLGSRLSEETVLKPKPMVEIGGKPILWHIMKIYSHYGITDFVICLGYRGYVIKEYFANYFLHNSDITIDLKKGGFDVHFNKAEPWKVTLVDTGLSSMTGGRIKRVQHHVGDSAFLMTYGDGLSNVDINKLVEFHRRSKKWCSVTAIQPPGRFGALDVNDRGEVKNFIEKPSGDGGWINGGFFVLEPEIFQFIEGDGTTWEQEPLRNLASQGQLAAYKHSGFWQPMDTLRDKQHLEQLWISPTPPWKVWDV
jgi:glucose-1-phosphate cytidylyltransferase